ncbi:hypothetical protein CsSME_00028709 [Camellia sinensis var. sinensis]
MAPIVLDIYHLTGFLPTGNPFTPDYPNPPVSFTIPSLNFYFSDFIMPEFAPLAKALASKKKIALAPHVLSHCKTLLLMEKNMLEFPSTLLTLLITSLSSINSQFSLFPPSSAPLKLTQGQHG